MGLNGLSVRYDFLFPMTTLVKHFKYQSELILADTLASLLPPPPFSLLPKSLAQPKPVLIPVPASPMRIRQRGYDHLFLIAQRYAKKFNLKIQCAKRLQDAAAQAKLGRRDRKHNSSKHFDLDPPGNAVLLLDDVVTTGATLSGLADKCRQKGAKWVGAVVLARTPSPSELPAEN
jgi:ComF family protein